VQLNVSIHLANVCCRTAQLRLGRAMGNTCSRTPTTAFTPTELHNAQRHLTGTNTEVIVLQTEEPSVQEHLEEFIIQAFMFV